MSDSSFSSSVAGPSSLATAQSTIPPPPDAIRLDDYAAADPARQRFNKRGLLSSISLPHLGRSRSRLSKRNSAASFPTLPDGEDPCLSPERPDFVALSEEPNTIPDDEDYDKDVYRWAILYENQRGATVFSTPYYSAQTLLPLDPPPFTIPTAIPSPRKNQPTVSLEDYPLPDGSWKWVSRAWLIDMRGDGQVQYDGFEYSRSFRSKSWGPSPGILSNRGLVRRRRWIRLMMRPAHVLQQDPETVLEAPYSQSALPELEHHEEGATRPPSVVLTLSDVSGETEVWRNDSDDWERCHAALRRLGRDGRKLELWINWLGLTDQTSVSRPQSWSPVVAPYLTVLSSDETNAGLNHVSDGLPTEDLASINISQSKPGNFVKTGDAGSPAAAFRDSIAAVIRSHASELLRMFVYPESRAKFLQLIGHVGLLPELRAGIGAMDSTQLLDFWSYTQAPNGDTC